MKLLFYISTIRSGGAARVMTNLANQFAEDGNDIYFLTNFADSMEYVLSKKVTRETIDETELNDNIIKKNARRCYRLRNYIKKIKPDVVISFMPENDARNYISTRGLKVRTVMSVRNDPKILFKGSIKKRLFRYIYNHADAVVFQTEDARNWFGDNFKPYNRIIMNQTAKKFYEVERSNCPQGIVTLGSFLPKKNHKLLIKAFSKIVDIVSDDLWIYGNGELEDEYIRLVMELNIQNRVHICNYSETPQLILAKAKLFVLSSNYEGMPNVLLEALACGVPTISTDCPCGGPRMVLENKKNGILVPINDANKLADAMKKILLDEQLQLSLSINARKKAELFAPETVYRIWYEFVNEIVERNI